MRLIEPQFAVAALVLPFAAGAGSLRVGPTRIDLSPRHPVVTLEVQNTGDAPTLVQADALSWIQDAGEEALDATSELVATPLVVSLAPGETQKIRVGLREPNRAPAERAYRVLVSEVNPTFLTSAGLRFAVRISVPVFAASDDSPVRVPSEPSTLSWRVRQGNPGCERVQVENSSTRHDRILRATLLGQNGEVLWQSDTPEYLLAGAQRSMHPQLCSQVVPPAAQLLLVTESRTFTLPPSVAGVLVDAQ
jgi:fimbrial chaperone protein